MIVRCPYCKESTEYLIFHLKNNCEKLMENKEIIERPASQKEIDLYLKTSISIRDKDIMKEEPDWEELKETSFYKTIKQWS